MRMLKILGIVIWVVAGTFTEAWSEEIQGPVRIDFLGSRSSTAVTKAKFAKLKKEICSTVGPAAIIGRGLYGSGLFDSYVCAEGGSTNVNAQWTIEVVGLDDELRLQLRRNQTGAKPLSVASIKHAKIDLEYFTSEAFASLAVYTMLERLGAIYPMSREDLVRGEFQPKLTRVLVPARWEVPRVSDRVIVKQVTQSDENNAELSPWFVGPHKPRLEESGDTVIGTAILNGDGNMYRVSRLRAFQSNAAINGALYVGPQPDKNVRLNQLQQSLDIAANDLADASGFGLMRRGGDVLKRFFVSSSANGHVGVRVGKAVGKSDKLFGKSTTVGVLAELRSGPLSGGRLYYDAVPEVKNNTGGVESSLSMGRVMAGYSLGYAMPKYRLRLDATPKIGSWTFKAKLPVVAEGVTAVVPFKVSSRVTAGLDLGLEYVLDVHTVRLWYGKDRLFPKMGPIGGGGQVSSSRFGLDYYWSNGPKFKLLRRDWRTTYLAFVNTDQIVLSGNGVGTDAQGSMIQAKTLIYDSSYAGLGFALSW